MLKRMLDRRFTEVVLRRMLEHAGGYRADIVEALPGIQQLAQTGHLDRE